MTTDELNRRELERAVREHKNPVKLELCEDCTLARQILQAFAGGALTIDLRMDGDKIGTVLSPKIVEVLFIPEAR